MLLMQLANVTLTCVPPTSTTTAVAVTTTAAPDPPCALQHASSPSELLSAAQRLAPLPPGTHAVIVLTSNLTLSGAPWPDAGVPVTANLSLVGVQGPVTALDVARRPSLFTLNCSVPGSQVGGSLGHRWVGDGVRRRDLYGGWCCILGRGRSG